MKVAVVTPTIGSDYLAECISSVQSQTYKNVVHYVFIDGEQYYENAEFIINGFRENPVKTIHLEENVGKGWYGHRVYAACSFLVNADVICYLDEDNWILPNHIETIVDKLQNDNLQWCYTLRNIHEKNGAFVCPDNCESLGQWPAYYDPTFYHIDTGCFAIRRDVAVAVGHAWYGQWGADRQFFNALRRHFPNFAGTCQYTSCYRLDGNENSVKKELFIEGNKRMTEYYGENYPWIKPFAKEPEFLTIKTDDFT